MLTANDVRSIDGFNTYCLRSDAVEVQIVPALGAKITSLRDLRTGREWLWHAPDGRGLSRSSPGDLFETSSLSGVDECIPTVNPCRRGGVDFPDHGEAWSRPWQIEAGPGCDGWRTALDLHCLPLRIERQARLNGATLLMDYTVTNRSDIHQPLFWCLHPLLATRPGDRIELPAAVSEVTVTAATGLPFTPGQTVPWPLATPGVDLSRPELNGHAAASVKMFAASLQDGLVALAAAGGRERLEIGFDAHLLPHVGVWITAGGWEGFHHVALEPGTHAADCPAEGEDVGGVVLPPGGRRTWQVRFTCSS